MITLSLPPKSALNDLARERPTIVLLQLQLLKDHCGLTGPLSRNISQASPQCRVSPHTHLTALEIDLETARCHVQNLLLQKAQLALQISHQREAIFAHAIDCPFTCFPFPSSEHHELLRHTSNLSIIQNRLDRTYHRALARLNALRSGSLPQPPH